MGRNWKRSYLKKSKKPMSTSSPSTATKTVEDSTSDNDHEEDTGTSMNNGDASSHQSRFFSSDEKELVIKYLVDYQRGAERVCFSSADVPSDDDTVVTAPSSSKRLHEQRQTPSCEESTVPVGGHAFPALSDHMLAQPYLRFPPSVTAKQRRFLHQSCIEVGLYHCSIDVPGQGRVVVISIHSDGFSHVPELNDAMPPPDDRPPIPVRQCRPWLLSKEKNGLEETEKQIQSIYALLDQPGTCLREDVDELDFKALENASLAMVDPPSEHDHWMLVDSAVKMRQCVQELHDAETLTEIGFDLEMYNPSKHVVVTCLLQLVSNVGKEYIIDTLAEGVWETVPLLAPLFADKNIVKIGHCIGGMDVKSLHLDFGIFVVNAFDTFEAAKVLRLPSKGLASVCQHYGLRDGEAYDDLKEDHQNMDWRKRPLSESMIRYGRYDVHYLIDLRKLMMRDLTRRELWDQDQRSRDAEAQMVAKTLASMLRTLEEEEGDVEFRSESELSTVSSNPSSDDGYYTPDDDNGPDDKDTKRKSRFGARELRMQADLMKVTSQSQERCLDLWNPKKESLHKNDAYLSIVKRAEAGRVKWTSSNMNLFQELDEWRTGIANDIGALPGLVCPLDFLANVAAQRPPCEASLRKINYHLPGLLDEDGSDYRSQLLALVRASLERDGLDPNESTVRTYDEVRILEEDVPPPRRNRSLAWKLATTAAVIAAVSIVAARRTRR